MSPIHTDAQAAFDDLMGEDYDSIIEVIPGVTASFGVKTCMIYAV